MKSMSLLAKSEENGLASKGYFYPYLKSKLSDADFDYAKNDILLTTSIIKFARDLKVGSGLPKNSPIDHYFEFMPESPKASKIIEDFTNIAEVEKFIEAYSPKHIEYKRLKNVLTKLLVDDSFEYPQIDKGKTIHPASRDYRIPMIREKLKSPKPINPKQSQDDIFYDKALYKTVVSLQKKFGLKADGIIGPKTLEIINYTKQDLIDKISVNMERWRWIPNITEGKRILVNIPEFKLYAYKDNEQVMSVTAIVGRAGKKTPIMNTHMTDVVFHPYWYAPKNYSLTYLVPLIKEDPYYFTDEEFTLIKVLENGAWEITDPETVDWENITEENFNYIIRQDPGNKNALGPIKFNIRNFDSIYLHGTAEPWLFSSRFRAQSSGCIRLEDPIRTAFFALEDNEDFNPDKLETLYRAYANDYEIPYYDKPKHVVKKLASEIPVFLNYITMFADDEGNMRFFDDIYGWDEEQKAY